MFRAVKVTNTSNPDPDKWHYSGYNIYFDSTVSFTHPDDNYGKNIIIFEANLRSSKYANNKTKSALALGHGLIQKIDDTTIYAEKMYSLNFTVDNKILF